MIPPFPTSAADCHRHQRSCGCSPKSCGCRRPIGAHTDRPTGGLNPLEWSKTTHLKSSASFSASSALARKEWHSSSRSTPFPQRTSAAQQLFVPSAARPGGLLAACLEAPPWMHPSGDAVCLKPLLGCMARSTPDFSERSIWINPSCRMILWTKPHGSLIRIRTCNIVLLCSTP